MRLCDIERGFPCMEREEKHSTLAGKLTRLKTFKHAGFHHNHMLIEMQINKLVGIFSMCCFMGGKLEPLVL